MTLVETACISSDGTEYIIPKPCIHEQKVTIHHWQLRDLIIARQDRPDELIVPTGRDIFRYNFQARSSSYLVKDVGYAPTCMTIGNGYWASGGQRGELTLRNISTEDEVTITTTPSKTINNGLAFSNLNGQLRLLVSNNDASVRVFSVPGLQLLQTIDFRTAVNHTSISPDETKMIVVGDDNRVHLFSITSAGTFEPVSIMAAARDANFSVAWNHSSEKFAVASQDGTVHVWDVRSRDPLYRFGGGNSSITKGAARCVKFTQSGAIDLLAFTEHVSHINIIDARTFDAQQTIRVGNSGVDTPITGLAFSQNSHSMFVGLENVILEYPVDTSARRRFPKGALL